MALEREYEPGYPFEVIDLAVRLQEKVPLSDGQIRRMTGNTAVVDDRPQARAASSQKTIPTPRFVPVRPPALDREKHEKYLRDLGFGQSQDLGGIRGASGQLAPPNLWLTAQYRNPAHGQGLGVTPLQMVTAFAAIARGGVVKRPQLIKAQLGPDGTPVRTHQPEAGRRVFDEAVAKQVLEAMHNATEPSTLRDPNSPQHTAGKGQLPNYTIAGRAGIAQQAENGRYSDTHRVSSLMAVTPVEKPRLVILTLIDTPKKSEPAAGRIVLHGGVVAAPVVREVARFALAYLGVPQSSGALDLDKDPPGPTR